MKFLLAGILSIATTIACSQQILIPYKSGDLYGLTTEAGKLMVQPIYNQLNWIEDGWFETGKNLLINDTLETSPNHFFRRNETINQTGLIYRGKVVLKDEAYDDYEIILGSCIVARAKSRSTTYTKEQYARYKKKEKFYSIFNLSGANLYPENFARIQKIDTTGTSSLHKNKSRYILFGARHLNDKHSFFVFDRDSQQISDWLIKDANNIKVADFDLSQKLITLNVTDQYYQTTLNTIDFSKGKFVLTTPTKKPLTKPYGIERGGTGNGGSEERITMKESFGLDENVAVPYKEEVDKKPEPPFVSYCEKTNDSLFLIAGKNNRKAIDLPTAVTIIFQDPRSVTQYGPIIFKNQHKFGLIVNGIPLATEYDSLVYFGNKFLSWKTINQQKKCGVIESDGSIAINFVYDSIYAGMRELYFENKRTNNSDGYQLVLKERGAKYDYTKAYAYKRQPSELLSVFKNGKWGVINMLEQTIIDIAYDMIAINGLSFMAPKQYEFIILKQHGLYGFTHLKYNRILKKSEMQDTILPIFSFIPGFHYQHYYNQAGYKLVGLYNEQYDFKGYGNEKGVTFFKK